MPATSNAANNASLTEVKVQVPTDRIANFYALMGEWLHNPDGARATRRRATKTRRRSGPSASRYAPIGGHLANIKEDTVTLTFDEIEDLIDGELPASAHKHRAWWANTDTHSQALIWISSGWLVSEANLEKGVISFRRE